MNKRNLLLLKILLFLFVLNSISLCLYFTSNSRTLTPSQTQTQPHPSLSLNRLPLTDQNHYPYRYSKPWPILPSYLPWSQTTPVPFRSCEAYFGNGFTKRVDLLKPKKDLSLNHMGWFRCWFSETLRSSVCEGGGLRMDPEKIKMSRGGEILEEVIGRGEEEEMPEFQNGAFQIDGGDGVSGGDQRPATQEFLDGYLPHGEIGKHTMRELVESVRIVPTTELQCNEWIEEPTLLVTRFEYANLFHTFTDWYSAYVASRVVGLPNRPHVVFVDGHCAASLEEMWRALFSSIGYAKNFSGPVCFRHAILSPLGYETPLFKGLSEDINCHGASAPDLWQHPNDQKTARLSEFGEMVRAAFGFSVHRHRIEKPASGHNVLFVRREDYLAHPRHHGKVQKRLSNEQEVFDAIKTWVSKRKECKINLVNGLFAHMSMNEQVQAIQDASVIIGAHGAGLTHIISAMPKTVILEIISSQYRRPHFGLIAQWKGLEYHAIHLDGSFASPPVVLDRLNNIMRSLGC